MEQGSEVISRHSGQCRTCSCPSTAPSPLLEPPPVQSVAKVRDGAHRGLSLVYESTKVSQQAFSILFICVSPLSSFYFP